MRWIPLCVLIIFSQTELWAQSGDRVAQSYRDFMKENTPIYNGSEYTGHGLDIEGSPFYQFKDLQLGTLVYDDVLYTQIPLQWDMVEDCVVTEDPNKSYLIRLDPEKISSFTIGNTTFIRSANPDNPDKTIGFYQVLCTGKITILGKKKKAILDRTTTEKNYRWFQEFDRYYLVKEDRSWVTVRNIGDLMRAYPQKQAAIKKWIDAQPLRFNKEPETLLLQWVQSFNLL